MEADDDELLILNELINYIETIFKIDSKKWLEFIKSKINSMHTNQVWALVDPPKRIKLDGNNSLREILAWITMYKLIRLD